MNTTDFSEIIVDDSTVLRLETAADADALYDLIDANRKYLSRWVYWVTDGYSREDNAKYVAENYQNYKDGLMLVMGIYVDGKIVGAIDVRDIKERVSEVGYWISEKFSGKGITTKVMVALLDYAEQHYDIKQFVLFAAADNIASNRVAEKLGFTKVGQTKNEKYGTLDNQYVKNIR